MRIAISIWEDKVSPLLDTVTKLLVIENALQREISRFEVYLLEQDIFRRCHFIRGLNINVLICGGVSRQFSGMLEASGMKVISGISGPAEEVVEAYRLDRLDDSGFFMPGHQSNTFRQLNRP